MKTLIFAALAAATVQATTPLGPPTDAQFTAAKRAFDEQLLDHTSARFRDVHGDAGAVCGFVNAKNRMGAYTGWTRFVVMFTSPPRLQIEDPERENVFVDVICKEDDARSTGRDYSDRLTHR